MSEARMLAAVVLALESARRAQWDMCDVLGRLEVSLTPSAADMVRQLIRKQKRRARMARKRRRGWA